MSENEYRRGFEDAKAAALRIVEARKGHWAHYNCDCHLCLLKPELAALEPGGPPSLEPNPDCPPDTFNEDYARAMLARYPGWRAGWKYGAAYALSYYQGNWPKFLSDLMLHRDKEREGPQPSKWD